MIFVQEFTGPVHRPYKNGRIVGAPIASTVRGWGPVIRAPYIHHVRGTVLSPIESFLNALEFCCGKQLVWILNSVLAYLQSHLQHQKTGNPFVWIAKNLYKTFHIC